MNQEGASKLTTGCKSLANDSYKCLELNPSNGLEVCKPAFDAYKECRKNEHNAIIEERRKKGVTLR